jgi:CrcB protein
MSFRNLLLVMTGGAFGSAARWAVAVFAEKTLPQTFPFGTLFANVVGSALLGAILAAGMGDTPRLSAEARLLLGTGVMGGFTTYSTFNAEVLRAVQAGALGKAALYLSVTLVLCLLGGAAGFALARA